MTKLMPTQFREMNPVAAQGSTISATKNEMIVTVIRPGVNKSGTRYYSPELLRTHAKMFEGSKMYIDHLTPQQERALGGMPRSVRDLVATLKEAWWDEASQSVKGRAKVVQDWFMELVTNDPTAVGVSIDALGTARNGVVNGKRLRVAESFTKARSVDFVTLPGAGGEIDTILEAHMEDDLMALETITLEDLIKHRPELIKEAVETAQVNETPKDNDNDAEVISKADVAEMIKEAVTTATTEMATTLKADADKQVRDARHTSIIKEAVISTKLPEPAQEAIIESLSGRVFDADGEKDADVVCKEAVDTAIERKRAEIKAIAPGARITGMGTTMQEGENGGGAAMATPVNDKIRTALGIAAPSDNKGGE